jgi:hypothetical protein
MTGVNDLEKTWLLNYMICDLPLPCGVIMGHNLVNLLLKVVVIDHLRMTDALRSANSQIVSSVL